MSVSFNQNGTVDEQRFPKSVFVGVIRVKGVPSLSDFTMTRTGLAFY